jgi:hypothetical protein
MKTRAMNMERLAGPNGSRGKLEDGKESPSDSSQFLFSDFEF